MCISPQLIYANISATSTTLSSKSDPLDVNLNPLRMYRAPVVVTEFGFPVFGEAEKADLTDELFDTPRSLYYLSYMSEILKAIWEDGVDVRGAFAWSFADNWE